MNPKPIRQQFADTMFDIGRSDPNLIVLVGDISHFILQPFARACPGRYYNVGICEPTIVSMAAGLSRMGFYPVVHTIAPFILERSYEQLKLDFCYQQLGGTMITVGGAFDYSNLGCTHHCYSDFALLKVLPGTEIIYPGSAVEFDALFRQIYRDDKLKLIRIPARQHGIEIAADDIHLGKALCMREGSNLTVVAIGPHLSTALEAADHLSLIGWDTEILYCHTIKPLDRDMLADSILKTRRVIVIEEHMRSGGLGEDVLKLANSLGITAFASLSIPDRFVTGYGSYEDHLSELGLTPEGLGATVKGRFGSPEKPVITPRRVYDRQRSPESVTN